MSPARAQSGPAALSLTHLEAVAEPSGEVRVTARVSVLDETGQPVTGLGAGDFTVSENNLPIAPQSLTVGPAEAPFSVALLIDTSSGMAKPGPDGVRAIDAAKDAAAAFIDRLGPDDEVAVYEFNSRAVSQQDFTLDHNLAIDQGVLKLDAREVAEACLTGALRQVLARLAANPAEPRAIIALTGHPPAETCPVTPVEEVVDAATAVGNIIPIFTVGFGGKVDQTELTRLAQGSGGRFLPVADAATLNEAVASVLRQWQNQYTLSYPTLAAPGVATVIVFETGSELSARRQVAIPAAIVPTATPLPQYALAISIEQPSGDKVAVNVAIPPEISLTQTELLVDGQSLAVATAPPFDQFVLDVNQLGSGNHTIRVEAVDTNQVSASAEVELMLTLPPTPPPAPTLPPPTPVPTPVVETAAPSSLLVLPLVLICLGLLLLLALMGFISYLLLARAKPPVPSLEPTQPVPPRYAPAAPSPAFTPLDEDDAADKTLLQGPTMVPGSARLVVVMGQELVNQPEFLLRQPETKIGRNTGKERATMWLLKIRRSRALTP
jgi:hypothetical protein